MTAQTARITRTLEAGTYTIEATAYAEMVTGSFTLTVASQGCHEQSGHVHVLERRGGHQRRLDRAMPTRCTTSVGNTSVYFSFRLTGTAEVTLDLTSSTVDTFLALHYSYNLGIRITSDNDGGTGTNCPDPCRSCREARIRSKRRHTAAG